MSHEAVNTEETKPAEPAFSVVKGSPTDDEVAALVAVLSAAAADAAQTPESTRPPELWGAPVSMHRGDSPFSPYSFVHLSVPRA
nr:acyl-CoA carboxylase subunit epsilon [Spelaeibacter cavernicola]